MIDVFQAAAEAVGACVKRFTGVTEAVSYVRELGGGLPMSASHLPADITEAFAGTHFVQPEEFALTRLCVSYAQAGIAATGSLLLDLAHQRDRSATSLAIVHAVFLKASTILPDLYALQDSISRQLGSSGAVRLSITTGPSRTADIERVLTIGVHGAKELHVLIVEGE